MVVLTRETGLLLVDLCLLAGGPPPGPPPSSTSPLPASNVLLQLLDWGREAGGEAKKKVASAALLLYSPRCETCP
ncbi:MAG: hypothetical protein J3Q66DRAFT_336203 [Benniella sp.]|nr:MAG: hypothetical protein J3Q66DRAFT_336203 [Benniella sp.]